ncbi:hypothetical protein Clocl_0768 [Acetivibrio clariflavus DSM 19732]|uniref:Uncharacterized protein n=1 Tax=Acetivibrio clariflavus (strain DSM 19732 / NBRC 101661 / EBR45) TaxID=720554 RepID=G8LVB4_ACECE|nr:hypothetical protein Clocl_0768 [Acetivibrio clariflavus DSM 19732]
MLTSLAIMIILGLLANAIFTKLKLPGLVGILILSVFSVRMLTLNNLSKIFCYTHKQCFFTL